jgi:hypothetical protein
MTAQTIARHRAPTDSDMGWRAAIATMHPRRTATAVRTRHRL